MLAALVLLTFLYRAQVVAYSPEAPQSATTTPKILVKMPVVTIADATSTIHALSQQYGFSAQKEARWLATVRCESKFKPKAINLNDPYGGSRGIGQFLTSTYDTWGVLAGFKPKELNIWNARQQLEVMAFMWSRGQQHQWSCYNLLYGY